MYLSDVRVNKSNSLKFAIKYFIFVFDRIKTL